jgi:hypothetical protein
MNKFLITGLKRSGTTFISSLLNSNNNISCVEYKLMSMKNINSVLDLNRYNSITFANFLHYPVEPPLVKNIGIRKEELINNFLKNLSEHYNVEHVGFKETQLSLNQIKEAIKFGFKIIITKRDIADVYKSSINRFNNTNFNIACEIKKYLDDVNNFKFNSEISEKILIIDLNEFKNNNEEVLNKLSKFLGVKIDYSKNLYYSFNKGLKFTQINSSFFLNYNLNKKDLSYISFIQGKKNFYFYKYLIFQALLKIKKNLKFF